MTEPEDRIELLTVGLPIDADVFVALVEALAEEYPGLRLSGGDGSVTLWRVPPTQTDSPHP